jgi:hypothetical protein
VGVAKRHARCFGGGGGCTLSVVNAHRLGAAVAKSPKVLRFFGEGRHVLFHVCGWCRRFVGAAS